VSQSAPIRECDAGYGRQRCLIIAQCPRIGRLTGRRTAVFVRSGAAFQQMDASIYNARTRKARAHMRRLLSKTDLQVFSSFLALALLLSTIPLTTGIVVVTGPSHPEFTINICQPIQILNHPSHFSLARPSLNLPRFVLFSHGARDDTPVVGVVERNVAPETPPPKPLV